jgi:hypothetical protein
LGKAKDLSIATRVPQKLFNLRNHATLAKEASGGTSYVAIFFNTAQGKKDKF